MMLMNIDDMFLLASLQNYILSLCFPLPLYYHPGPTMHRLSRRLLLPGWSRHKLHGGLRRRLLVRCRSGPVQPQHGCHQRHIQRLLPVARRPYWIRRGVSEGLHVPRRYDPADWLRCWVLPGPGGWRVVHRMSRRLVLLVRLMLTVLNVFSSACFREKWLHTNMISWLCLTIRGRPWCPRKGAMR